MRSNEDRGDFANLVPDVDFGMVVSHKLMLLVFESTATAKREARDKAVAFEQATVFAVRVCGDIA